MKLFLRAFIQVFLVGANVYFISHLMYLWIAIFGFLISYVWCFNVVKVSVSTGRDKVVYATGAMFGSITGVWFSSLMN